MRVNRFLLPLVALVALLGTILLAQATGLWLTNGRTAISTTHMTVDDIKGWMTLQQVIDGIPMAHDELYALAGIPADVPPTTALKDLESFISVTTLRARLAEHMGTPVTSTNAGQSSPTVSGTPGASITPTGSSNGQVLPADQIKGRMTLREVSDQCAVPFEQLLASLKLPATTNEGTAIKDLVSAGTLTDVTEVQKAVAALQ